ncbi:hypothetical protein CEXT_159291 [Caerostris extrusa]|uniref:Uncharacterized protein n=1 Tax=Caerostris extrusa TaxID=172846 RepID=A0AAV4NQE8_CAEEX|nr:hypothetical protein CEXT_159291 [Caerostris extrusa]
MSSPGQEFNKAIDRGSDKFTVLSDILKIAFNKREISLFTVHARENRRIGMSTRVEEEKLISAGKDNSNGVLRSALCKSKEYPYESHFRGWH